MKTTMTEPVLFDAETLREFTEKVFERIGVPSDDARLAADILLESDRRGIDSHGLARLFPCYLRIKKGLIKTRSEIEIKW